MSAAWADGAHWGCVLVVGLAVAAVAWRMIHHPGVLGRWLAVHVRGLDRRLFVLRAPFDGRQVACMQGGMVALGLATALLVSPALGCTLICAPGIVVPLLDARVNERLARLDMQLEAWLRALSGSLASGASLGQALEESAGLVESPLREEVVQACRETGLGIGVSESLRRMASRVGSATLSTAVAAIRIGQRSGGGLPRTLRESAAALREMARLEGVVRTRTAEARAQATVVGLIPLPMVGFIHHLDPHLMAPLWEHEQGGFVIALAVALWAVSILAARRILNVDI